MAGIFDDLIPASSGAPGPDGRLRITVTPNAPTVTDRIVQAESAKNATARNPRSSAEGLGQFIDSTWMDMVERSRPDLMAGRTRQDVLDLRRNPEISHEMTDRLAESNAKVLTGRGLPVTPGTTYLAHFAGPQGAIRVLSVDPTTPVERVLSAAAINANPFLRGMTAGDLRAWADRKMGIGEELSSQAKRPAAQTQLTRGPDLPPPDGGIFSDLIPQSQPSGQTPPDVAQRIGREGGYVPAREIGVFEAAGRGVARGLTANFYDELRGLMEAGGLDPNDPASLSALISGAYKYWSGDPRAATRYTISKSREQQLSEQADKEQPFASIGGQMAGAIALPVGGMLNAATMPARIARSAAVGAGYGGLSAAGEGDGFEDRATKAASGAAIGAGMGAVAPPVLAGIEGGARAINQRLVEPVRNALRGQSGVDDAATRRVVSAITRDIRQGGAEMSPQEFMAARAAGSPVTVAEMGGETTRAVARSAADTSPEGRAALQRLADDRFEGQADRATQFIRRLIGGTPDTGAAREALRTQAQTMNRPAYMRAYRHPNAQGMWDEGFQQISQAPVVQDAIRAASVTAGNRGTIDGFQRMRSPFEIDKQTGQLILRTNPDGSRALPNLQFWDHVKRNLDKINTPEARTLNSALKAHLDQLVPEYKAARAGAARFFDAEDALTAGENFVRLNRNLGDVRRALAGMSNEERELFRQGFAARLIDEIWSKRDRVNVIDKIHGAPMARQKLEMVLGGDGYKQFRAFVQIEESMDKLRTAVQGNSQTARYLYQLGLAGGGGVGGYGAMNTDPQTMVAGAVVALLSQRGKKIDERVARRVAEMLTSTDPNVLARGVRMASNNQQFLRTFRDLDQSLSRVGAQQTAGLPGLQLPVTGRTDSDQPSVPRPPSQ